MSFDNCIDLWTHDPIIPEILTSIDNYCSHFFHIDFTNLFLNFM